MNKCTSYFIVKCSSLDRFTKSIETEHWAYRHRLNPPQPEELLRDAHKRGRVILIFSVNNQHGWHGFCESGFNKIQEAHLMEVNEAPALDEKATENDDNWHHFPIKWLKHFVPLSISSCLPLEQTRHLKLIDGSPVNQARNWQQLSEEAGQKLCDLILEHYEYLRNKKELADKRKQTHKESFFKAEEGTIMSSEEIKDGWTSVIQKVERDLGRVLLACPFGSQRYNCNLPDSDNDIFIVYQAKTTDILGLDPPKQTIKNSESEKVDYTILEVQRYCELLVSGDPKCIETLFIYEDSILPVASLKWQFLRKLGNLLLSRSCVDKYLREAQGSRGIKQLEKFHSQKMDFCPKMNKLGYIVLRLLQNAHDIVKENCIEVYRPSNSNRQIELLNARRGQLEFSSLMALIQKYIDGINTHLDKCQDLVVDAKSNIQKWLVDCRLDDLQMDKLTTETNS